MNNQVENTDLLENSDSLQDVQVKAAGEVLTEVTSIKSEEQRTGQKIHTPFREELVARASSSMIVDLQRLSQVLLQTKPGGTSRKMGNHALVRTILAILSMPTAGIPVNLVSDSEKLAYALGQKLISSRFILTQDHISTQIAEQRKLEENKQVETNVTTNNTQGELQ